MPSATGPQQKHILQAVLERFGHTYAEQAEISLADKPSPLYQLLVLTTLLSHRIAADIAVEGAKALFAAGYRTPQHMKEASWQDRVDALGRGNFRRYDESTATTLAEVADVLIERWDGDLRQLRDAADCDPRRIQDLLQEFKGIGPTGAAIYLREVQAVWPGVAPYVDAKVLDGAKAVGLPADPQKLADLAGSAPDLARLASALVRVALEPDAAKEITA